MKKFKVNDWLLFQLEGGSTWEFAQLVGTTPTRVYFDNVVYDYVDIERIKPILISDVLERFATLWDNKSWLMDECFSLKLSVLGGFNVYYNDPRYFNPAISLRRNVTYLHELQECYREKTKQEADFGWFLEEALPA